MELAAVTPTRLFPSCSSLSIPRRPLFQSEALAFRVFPCSFGSCRNASVVSFAKKRDSSSQQVLKREVGEDVAEQVVVDDDGAEVQEEGGAEEEFAQDFDESDILIEEDEEDFEEDFEVDDSNSSIGDGAGGGGISLAGTWWDKEALAIAEEVSMSFDGDLKIYAFKTSANSTIRLRIEKLSSKSGSPSMTDIEAFSSAYQSRLDEAERAGTVPMDLSLEVSSPGVERVVRIPEDLERFKDRPMYVKYITDKIAPATSQESEGIFQLISVDMDLCNCTWGIADVKKNREKAGKGRPLSKKQREWRLQTRFDSLGLVRIYSDC